MFENLLTEQNPHWNGTLYEAGIERECFQKFLQFLETKMIISVMGVRRAGKSTLLKQAINHLIQIERVKPTNILFLNLEHPYLSQYNDVIHLQKIYESYLQLTIPEGKIYCFLDEVQYFSNWQIFVKAHFENKNIKFVITGSNSALLSSELMTLLSGRTLPIDVFPLSFTELATYHAINTKTTLQLSQNRHKLQRLTEEYLHFGGFPEVAATENHTVAYEILNAYAKTILYQDVAKRLQVRHSAELEKLFVYLSSNIAKPFSYNNLSTLFSLSDKSIKEYIKAFEDSYLLFTVDLYAYSLKKQLRNPKKIYSIDMGQINAVSFKFTENLGRLLENSVYLQLKRLGYEVYYYKTEQDLEVDFIAKRGMNHSLIQVAWNLEEAQTRKREITALAQSLEEMKVDKGFLITFDDNEEVIEGKQLIHVLPAYKFFSLTESLLQSNP